MAALLERRAGPVPAAEADGSRWGTLYRVGGAAALASAVFLPIQVAVFIAWPPPSTVLGWFRLFQDHRIVGLVDLDLLLVADNLLLVAVLLALYVALRRVSASVMAIATTAGLLGIALFIASNPAFQLLSLSDRYAAPPPTRSGRPCSPRARRCWPAGRAPPSRPPTCSGPWPVSRSGW